MEKLSRPIKNLYTQTTEKENDDAHDTLTSQIAKPLKKDSKYKMLTKVTETGLHHMRKDSSKICFNNVVRNNNYFSDDKVIDWKNFKSEDKV